MCLADFVRKMGLVICGRCRRMPIRRGDDGAFFESGVGAPFGEFDAGETETVAEFDEHVQGHQECEGVGVRQASSIIRCRAPAASTGVDSPSTDQVPLPGLKQ